MRYVLRSRTKRKVAQDMRNLITTVVAVFALVLTVTAASVARSTVGDTSAANAVLSRVASYPVILNCDEVAWNTIVETNYPGQGAQWHIFVWSSNALQSRDGVTLYLRPDYCAALAALKLDPSTVDVQIAAEATYWVVGSGIALQSFVDASWSLNGSWDACRAVSTLGLFLPEFGVPKVVRGVVGTKVTRKLVRVIKKTVKGKDGKKRVIVVRRVYKTIKTPIYGDVPNPQYAQILEAARLYAAC